MIAGVVHRGGAAKGISRGLLDRTYLQGYRALYEGHWWWRAREHFLLRVIRGLGLRPGGAILDVGCGDGLFFDRLREFGEVEGVESEASLISPSGPDRGRIFHQPFDAAFAPGRRYALILLADVLEHLADPAAALRHAATLLEPDGRIVVTVPAFRALWTRHDDLNGHKTRYDRRGFAALARQGGIEVCRASYFFHWTAAAKLIVRLGEAVRPGPPTPPAIPPRAINVAAWWLSRAEDAVFHHAPLPWGSSLLVVARASQ